MGFKIDGEQVVFLNGDGSVRFSIQTMNNRITIKSKQINDVLLLKSIHTGDAGVIELPNEDTCS